MYFSTKAGRVELASDKGCEPGNGKPGGLEGIKAAAGRLEPRIAEVIALAECNVCFIRSCPVKNVRNISALRIMAPDGINEKSMHFGRSCT